MPEHRAAVWQNTQGSKEKKQKPDRMDLHNSATRVLCSSEPIPFMIFLEIACKLAGNLKHQEEREALQA